MKEQNKDRAKAGSVGAALALILEHIGYTLWPLVEQYLRGL